MAGAHERVTRGRRVLLSVILSLWQAGCGANGLGVLDGSGALCTVSSVIDGDSLRCADGRQMRLLLIDAPELGQAPWGDQARAALLDIAPITTRLSVEYDVVRSDTFGRDLAYLYRSDGTMVNERMGRRGYAVPLVIPPNGRYEGRIRAAVAEAEAAERGLWAEWKFACLPVDYRAGRCT